MPEAAFSLPAGLPTDPALLSTLLSLMPMGVIYYTPVVDSGGTLTDLAIAYLNPAAQRMTQLPAQPGTTYRQQFPTTDDNGAWDFHRRSWLAQEAQQFQFYYDADGFDGYFRVTAQHLAEGLLVVFTDTQDEVRSQVEQALLNSQTRERAARAEAERQRGELERAFEQAPVAIAVYRGAKYVIELANATVARLWGRTRDQLLGKGLFEALPEVAGMGYEQLLDGVMATGEPHVAHAMEAQHARNGRLETVYWDFVYVPTYEADGRINGVMVVATEVTAQVRARQQLEQLNQDLETRVLERMQVAQHALAEAERQRRVVTELVEQAPAALCVVSGPDYIYETFNPLYAAMFGGRPQVGRPMGEVLPEVVNHPSFLAFRTVYEHGRTIRQSEMLVPLLRPDDGVLEDHYFSYTQQPRYNSAGQIDGVFVFAVEVTEQVRARQQVQALNEALTATNSELNTSNTQLRRANVDLDTFVYTASHDLKAPITNIESIVLALRDTLPPAVQQDDLVTHLFDLLDKTTARFQFTIAQLTDLTKLQLVHAGLSEAVHLVDVIESVRLDLAPAIVATEARLTVEVAPELVVSFSPANLRSIVYNLLSNAVKYRALDRSAQIHVRAMPAPQGVVLTVADNGLGLSEHQRGRLFGLFQRLHDHVEGTGVGLYITKRLVENGGGSIAVESKLNAGTTFTVTLPV